MQEILCFLFCTSPRILTTHYKQQIYDHAQLPSSQILSKLKTLLRALPHDLIFFIFCIKETAQIQILLHSASEMRKTMTYVSRKKKPTQNPPKNQKNTT